MEDAQATPDPKAKAATAPDALAGAQAPETIVEAASAPSGAAPQPVEQDDADASLSHKLLEWISGHIAGGPIARNTDCWNALHAALPALRASLLKGD